MIQFNLLPDVKLEYIKAAKTRRIVTAISGIVSIAAVGLLLILLATNAVQTKHLNDLNKDIKASSAKITRNKELNRILTVQNQLNSLTGLHSAKPTVSRLPNYLNQVTPAQVKINSVTTDYILFKVTIAGTTDSLASVNQYVDTLKFTDYTLKGSDEKKRAFSGVVLSAFSLSKTEATYAISLSYDPLIFDITQTPKLTVPKQVTTRSQVDQPTDLFALPIDKPNPGTGQ